MNYIDTIKLPSQEEINRYSAIKNYSLYPWTIFFQNQFEWVICKDITVFYGNNGSGKSTLINLIAEKINAQRNNELFKKGVELICLMKKMLGVYKEFSIGKLL